jgi:hypothetical protein
MSQRLPSAPNLDHLKKQAKDVLRIARHGRPHWRLADAQQALARGYGFATWRDLKLHVESIRVHARAAPSDRTAAKSGTSNGSGHLILGTWTTARASTDSPTRTDVPSIVVEFVLVNDAFVLTQIGPDGTGRDVAMKMAIHVDGDEHPVPFGDDVTLRATWVDVHTLETIVRRGDQMAWRATYEVSADGRSLAVASSEQLVRFERVQAE